ncbi:MAG: hypothetical protein E6H78_00955 [Betaproteobacteria bacterium]|nr:MAG: hypothetical protein E6H78_00955 [Betaproteobacteria bacterium]
MLAGRRGATCRVHCDVAALRGRFPEGRRLRHETLRGKLTELFALAEAHRFVTLRLVFLTEAHLLGSIDFRILVYVGSALLLLAGGLLISAVDRDARPLFTGIAAAFLLSPDNYEASLWTTGALEHFGLVGYAFASLYCLSRPGVGWQIGAGVLALAAAGTSASGLMLVPAGGLLLGLMRRWRGALVWTLCGAALFAVYFIGYEAPPYQGSLGTYLRDPLVPARFLFMAVGGFGIYPSVALGFGVALSTYWVWMTASGRIRSLPPIVVAWVAFLLLSFAAIAWGRASFGDRGALVSRYRVYSELLVLLSLAALFWQLPRAYGMRLLWAVLPLSLLWALAGWRHELPQLEGFFIINQSHLDYYAAEGSSVPDDLMSAAFRDLRLEAARQLGTYDPKRAARAPRDLVAETRVLDATRPASVWVVTPSVGRRAMVVNAYGPGHEGDGMVWLENGERSYRGKLEAAPPAPLALGHRTGILWGVYSLAGVTRGRYRVGVGSDDATRPAVVWSDYWINVE